MATAPHTDDERTDAETHFGFSSVPLDKKQARVNTVFHDVASHYDIMNDLMSGGLHRLWKDTLVSHVKPSRTRHYRHLDVAGGTGDVAFRVAAAGGGMTEVTVLDINIDMLQVGRARATRRKLAIVPSFVDANAESLPFGPNTYDSYTIAFGIRNVPRIEAALAEAHRVLKRGGQFLCLEFSNVPNTFVDRLYEAYSFHVIPRIGQVVTGNGEAYRYLVESIRRFPDAERFRGMIQDAGFARASYTRMSGGIVAIHSGWKL